MEGGTLGRENTSLEEGGKKKKGREKESRDLETQRDKREIIKGGGGERGSKSRETGTGLGGER